MLKKIIALFVIFAMLVPFSTVVAADEPSAQPTVEEILNEYHRKSSEARLAQETGATSAYSRGASGSSKTLEEETVDQLTEAGYEAYNVTGSNYEALEESLQTDFASMGLDPSGSYILVISGDASTPQNTSRGSDVILPPHIWDDPGGGSNGDSSNEFSYIYNDRSFRVRYVTVTSAENNGYGQVSVYDIANAAEGFSFSDTLKCTLATLLNNVIYATIDYATPVPLGTIASMCGVEFFDFAHTDDTAFEALAMYGCSSWSRTFTEVYVESETQWKPYLYAEYVTAYSFFTGAYYDASLQRYTQIERNERMSTTYSPNYYNTTFRIEKAIEKYLQGEPGSFYYDRTGKVKYLIGDKVVITHDDSVPY